MSKDKQSTHEESLTKLVRNIFFMGCIITHDNLNVKVVDLTQELTTLSLKLVLETDHISGEYTELGDQLYATMEWQKDYIVKKAMETLAELKKEKPNQSLEREIMLLANIFRKSIAPYFNTLDEEIDNPFMEHEDFNELEW